MAVDGVVDFSQARLFDRSWQARLLLLSQAYQKSKLAQNITMYFNRAISGASSDNVEYAKECLNQSQKIVARFVELNTPWLDRDTKPKTQYNEYLSLIEEYKRRFGDPSKKKNA